MLLCGNRVKTFKMVVSKLRVLKYPPGNYIIIDHALTQLGKLLTRKLFIITKLVV